MATVYKGPFKQYNGVDYDTFHFETEVDQVIGIDELKIKDWKNGESYKAGMYVIYNKNLYRALSAHTSGAAFTADMQAGSEKWELIGSQSGSMAEWAANKSYAVGDLVIQGKRIYRALAAHTSAAAFANDMQTGAEKWEEISNCGGASIEVSATQPTNQKPGDVWIDIS